jgi:ABC-type transport system involved in multi-copper enzyme maturation permease subunit
VSAQGFWRDVAVVAGHELSEALRSRRVLILAMLYVGGAVAGTAIFVDVLESIEASLAQALEVSDPGGAGAMTRGFMQTEEFTKLLTKLIHDEGLAKELAGLPPLALFYGWMALTFSPVLVILTASETISQELSQGAIRFSLLRSDRLAFSVGKLVGQCFLLMVAVSVGAAGVWATGYFGMQEFEGADTALWLGLLSMRAWVFGFAYLGLALGLSHVTRSVPVSRALGLLSMLALGALWGLGKSEWAQERAPALADGLLSLLPRAHLLDMWRPELLDRAPAMLMLVALGLGYFGLGFRFRERRDV